MRVEDLGWAVTTKVLIRGQIVRPWVQSSQASVRGAKAREYQSSHTWEAGIGSLCCSVCSIWMQQEATPRTELLVELGISLVGEGVSETLDHLSCGILRPHREEGIREGPGRAQSLGV